MVDWENEAISCKEAHYLVCLLLNKVCLLIDPIHPFLQIRHTAALLPALNLHSKKAQVPQGAVLRTSQHTMTKESLSDAHELKGLPRVANFSLGHNYQLPLNLICSAQQQSFTGELVCHVVSRGPNIE